MKYKYVVKLISIASFVLVSGCAQMQALNDKMESMAAESRAKVYASVEDKVLVDSLYVNSPEGKPLPSKNVAADNYYFKDLLASTIVFKKDMYRSGNMGDMAATMNSYIYDSESDSLSKAYIEMAKKRGNTVKVFKPAFTRVVNSMFVQPFTPMQQTAQWYDRDVTLIEYNSSARPVSVLTRGHQAQTSLGVASYMYARIYFGQANMRFLENKVPNSYFSEYLLREIK